jgi:hypothetical protein
MDNTTAAVEPDAMDTLYQDIIQLLDRIIQQMAQMEAI